MFNNVVGYWAYIRRTYIRGGVLYSGGGLYSADLYSGGVIFGGGLIFGGLIFGGGYIRGGLIFGGLIFGGGVIFGGAYIRGGGTYIRGAYIRGGSPLHCPFSRLYVVWCFHICLSVPAIDRHISKKYIYEVIWINIKIFGHLVPIR